MRYKIDRAYKSRIGSLATLEQNNDSVSTTAATSESHMVPIASIHFISAEAVEN
jgi:hypothetical protein